MFKKTLIQLSCLGLLFPLAACSGAPESPVSPSTNDSAAPSSSSATSEEAPSSPSSEPVDSEDPLPAQEIPSVIHGKWVAFKQGETPRECTDELDNEGAILTIDATRISSFAFLFDLESIEESDDDSLVGLFKYHDDSDQPATPRVKLETTDDWQSFELIELDTEGQDQELYARCS